MENYSAHHVVSSCASNGLKVARIFNVFDRRKIARSRPALMSDSSNLMPRSNLLTGLEQASPTDVLSDFRPVEHGLQRNNK
jgi:hypothetical protein